MRGGGLAALVTVTLGFATGTGWAAAPCDEYDPLGPAQTAQITLGPADFVDETRDEMRSFVATDSLGKVDVTVLSAKPDGFIRSVSAVPAISRYSANYGEALKGIDVTIAVVPGVPKMKRPATVKISVRQVCAKYFRNSFLYR
jgi:hypothetical protein